ncbi:flagellar motor protein MotB [Limnohabitans sp. yimb22184]|jgi:chemotaxis protein MotB|uniref:flagellar motor protein MotB n=1 Tax=Limnohabitans sp. YIMB22184 TaxID=3374104 RepID=UPI003A84B495
MAEADKAAPGTPEEVAAAEAAAAEAARPIIIVKKIIADDGHAGAHGGAWKIALADMMTAMMAFFLLMWLLGASTEDKRKSVADYFRPASHSQIVFGELAGSNGLFGGQSIIDTDGFPFTAKQSAMLERLTPQAQGGPAESFGSSKEEFNKDGPSEQDPGKDSGSGSPGQGGGSGSAGQQDKQNFDKLEKEIKQKLSESKQFEKIKDQVSITRDKEGLRIEVIDKADFAMYGSGGAEMGAKAAALMTEVTKTLKPLPNKLAIRGHTDSTGFPPESLRNNWSLSTERAEATRQFMQGQGISPNRFSRIEGVADTNPNVPGNPADPRNRRVSITVLNQ